MFRTPEWCTDVLLEHVTFRGARILDAGCGDGAILVRMFHQGYPLHRLAALDIRPQDHLGHPDLETHWCDFLQHDGRYAHVAMNPPYGGRKDTATKWVKHALTLVPNGGQVAALLRTNWFQSGAVLHRRADWLRENMPDIQISFDRRPSFDGKGTDSCEYSWFVWQKGVHPTYVKNHLVPCR